MTEFLQALHGYTFPGSWALLFPTPLALATLILFIWSLAPAFKGQVGAGFLGWLRLTWVLTLLPAVTGIIMAVGGGKVPSSVAAPAEVQQDLCGRVAHLTRYCLPADPVRDMEHWMYSGFTLLSLLALEGLLRGRWGDNRWGLKLLPVITLFLYGCVYMVGRVAVLPGNSAGA